MCFLKSISCGYLKKSGNQATAPAFAKYGGLKFRGFINAIFYCLPNLIILPIHFGN